ncbi:YfhE family protein [Paenisporosarcina indica]|uniref:YfhE family protein n=1 Tax=Paenisporosarcina indica TaxID=650093 RepID=UPI00094FDA22|nr:YfhE family protein [Paenisporosarcina indica]
MKPKKEPHEQLTTKNNGLSATQEVLYDEEFRKSDKANKVQDKEGNEKRNL